VVCVQGLLCMITSVPLSRDRIKTRRVRTLSGLFIDVMHEKDSSEYLVLHDVE
jgi:hypothetical protein